MTISNVDALITGCAGAHGRGEHVEIRHPPLGEIRLGVSQLPDECPVGQNGDGFLQSLDVVRRHDHGRGLAVDGHGDSLVLTAHPTDDFIQVSLHFGQWHRRYGHKCD